MEWLPANLSEHRYARVDLRLGRAVHVEKLRCTPADLGITDVPDGVRIEAIAVPREVFPQGPWQWQLPGRNVPQAVIGWRVIGPDNPVARESLECWAAQRRVYAPDEVRGPHYAALQMALTRLLLGPPPSRPPRAE